VFKGCKILEFCRFEPRMVIQDGHAAWLKRLEVAEQEAATEAQKASDEKPEVAAELAEATTAKPPRRPG
jgi:hypothetical protein